MGGKHLKKLRAEKAKVQLKKKKVLAKAQNVTNTTFKTKKIVTLEQLKKVNENEPVSSWNLTLKDLITRLSHHNYSTRLNSLTGIKELITNFPQILQGPSLGLIITRVLELLMDVEHKIRITVVHLLSDIFRELPSHYLIPFYDILNTHVACAMTHRELPIQQDSLKFINVMIEFAPDAVKRKFPTLIKNFIRIISGYKYDHHSKGVFSKNSKRDLEKSKIEMFSKFYQLLEAMYSVPEDIQKSEKNDIEVLSNKCRFELRNHNNLYKRIPDLSSLFKNSQSCQFVSEGQHLNEFQVQISDIMPVLFDIWAEFATTGESDKFTSECQLTEGVAELLEIILEIILLLYEKILAMKSQHLESWFISTYEATFCKQFLSKFPYVPTASALQSINNDHQELLQKRFTPYLTQNLTLCYLYHRLRNKHANGELEIKMEKYVLDSMRVKNPTGFKILAKVLDVMIDCPRKNLLESLISSIIKVHDYTSNPEYRRYLFSILLKVAFSEKNTLVREMESFKKWINSLPDKLLEETIPLYVIKAILKIVNQGVEREVNKNLEEKVFLILSALPNIQVEGCKNSFEGQKLIVHILYWCDDKVLENLLEKKSSWDKFYSQELKNCVLNVISYRLNNRRN